MGHQGNFPADNVLILYSTIYLRMGILPIWQRTLSCSEELYEICPVVNKKALAEDSVEIQRQRVTLAREHSWDARVARLEALLAAELET